jgi:hypothetical protein
MVERAYEAAMEFLETMGIYCLTTKRRVALTRQEILTAIREAPTEILMGTDRDRRIWKQRKIEGREQLNVCPGHHTPFSEDLAGLVVSNFAQIPRTSSKGSTLPISTGARSWAHRWKFMHHAARSTG